MRPVALILLLLPLAGCGYKTWWNPPFSAGFNPNRPPGDSENMQRVLGQEVTIEPMRTEPGDIWPGPLPAAPTLRDLQSSGGMSTQPQGPVPGSPLSRSGAAGPPNPAVGSSTPPGSNQPGLTPPSVAPPLSSYRAPPPARGPGGQVIPMQNGPAVTTGGGPGYQTTIQPGGGQSIVVPNGNGTSTVIHSDGRIETVPTPK